MTTISTITTFMRAAATVAVLALPLGLAVPAASTAHESKQPHSHGHKHDHDAMAKHGGTVAEVGPYDVEIVLGDSKMTVYVYDEHGEDISTKASKGDAILVVAGGSKKVALAPVDGRLEGAVDFATSPDDHLDTVLRLVIAGKTHTGKADVHPH